MMQEYDKGMFHLAELMTDKVFGNIVPCSCFLVLCSSVLGLVSDNCSANESRRGDCVRPLLMWCFGWLYVVNLHV